MFPFEFSFRTLKAKLLTTAVVTVLLAVSVVAGGAHFSGVRTIQRLMGAELSRQAHQLSTSVSRFHAQNWRELRSTARSLERNWELYSPETLQEFGSRADSELLPSLTELSLVDLGSGRVIVSSHAPRNGVDFEQKELLIRAKAGEERVLWGPVWDDVTLALGPSTSKQHDGVTLFYAMKVEPPGAGPMLLVGRLPNDVVSDILLAGNALTFPKTQENVLVAVNSAEGIDAGTLLSRTRYENEPWNGTTLREGVAIAEDQVLRVDRTSELEIAMRDAENSELAVPVVKLAEGVGWKQFERGEYRDYLGREAVGTAIAVPIEGSPRSWGLVITIQADDAYAAIGNNSYLAAGLALFMAALTFFALVIVIVRPMNELVKITARIRDTSQSVQSASQALGRSATSLAASATDQASAIAETMASMEEITAMVSSNNGAARDALERATANRGHADTGRAVVHEMERAMGAIAEQNGELAKVVEIIQNISDKTRVINDIVFETKLLSFNASIEAARAGEQGKGFAVVAEEVGNLARLSGKAAQEISALIDTSTKQVQTMVHVTGDAITEGIRVTEKARDAFGKISAATSEVSAMMESVALSSSEQQQGISQVAKAMAQMDSLTQNTAAASADAAGQSGDLRNAGERLQGVVRELDGLVGRAKEEQDAGGSTPRGPRSAERKEPPPASNTGDYDVEQAGMEQVPGYDDAAFG